MTESTVEIRPVDTFVSYDLPLTPAKARTLELLQSMYEGADGSPLKVFKTDSLVTLHIPKSIRRKVSESKQS